MDSSTHPVINPTPRPDLVDRLSGSDVCPTCRGRGSLLVTGPRDRRVCPACRGTGLVRPAGTTPQYESWLYAKRARKAAREVQR